MFSRSRNQNPFGFEDPKARSKWNMKTCALMICVILSVGFILLTFITSSEDSTINTQMTSVFQSLSQQQGEIDVLQNSVRSLNEGLYKVMDDVASLSQSVKDNESQQAQVNRLDSDIIEIKETLDVLNRELRSEMNSPNLALQQSLEDIQNLEKALEELVERIDKIESMERENDVVKVENNIIDKSIVEDENNNLIQNNVPETKGEAKRDHIYVVIVDFGAFVSVYERRRSKVIPCSFSDAIGVPSVDRIYETIDSLYQLQESGDQLSDFTILLSTVQSRKPYFDDLDSIQLVISSLYII